MERVENDQKSQFFYAFAANPGFIEIPNSNVEIRYIQGLCLQFNSIQRHLNTVSKFKNTQGYLKNIQTKEHSRTFQDPYVP